MRGLHHKRAIVTGSGRGIGRAIARRLADEGVTVAVNDIDEEHARETVDLIQDNGGAALTALADVTDLDEVREMVDGVINDLGGVELHVNNAGWDTIEWFLEQDPAVWDRIIDINYRGQINCCRVVAEYFVEAGVEGTFVNIASDAARVGSSGEAVYSGTKGGIISFTKTLARELARHQINCNVIAPGPTHTPLVESMREGSELAETILGSITGHIPLGRIANPEDVAGAVAFLSSDDAFYITGQVLSVSGGLTMVD